MIDIYSKYGIDKNLDSKSIRKILMQKQGEVRANAASASLNGKEIVEKIERETKELAEVIKYFKTDDRRKEYDIKSLVKTPEEQRNEISKMDNMKEISNQIKNVDDMEI